MKFGAIIKKIRKVMNKNNPSANKLRNYDTMEETKTLMNVNIR